MNLRTFKYIQKMLNEWEHLGSEINHARTRLIGHVPYIAPKAYLHIVYAPSSSPELSELPERLRQSIPKQLSDFLKHANGLSLFSGAIRLHGFVPHKREVEVHPHNYPSNIILPNTSARPKTLDKSSVLVAWYKYDNSQVSIEKDGTVIRFHPKNVTIPLQHWSSFDTWLTSEIECRSTFFNQDGQLRTSGKVAFAPNDQKR